MQILPLTAMGWGWVMLLLSNSRFKLGGYDCDGSTRDRSVLYT